MSRSMATTRYASTGSGGALLDKPVTGTIDGVNRVFTIPVSYTGNSFIELNGNVQVDGGVDYTYDGNVTITYVVAPPNTGGGDSHYIYMSGGSAFTPSGYQNPTSGAVNGSNAVFTWTAAPKAISVDNRSIQKTSSDGTTNWTGTTTTTLVIPPTFDIFGIS